MEFRKEVDIPRSELTIDHHSRLLLLGSCFIENIGAKLLDNKFQALVNPFGVLYNPSSIAQSLEILLDQIDINQTDAFYDKGLYHSFSYHSSFSHPDLDTFIQKANASRRLASNYIRSTQLLVVTFGTSFVYKHIDSQRIVSNCHKVPAKSFERYMLSVDAIVQQWLALIHRLKTVNPSLKILFTVSPIRHLKDGAHRNQLSKATLLLAIDQILKQTTSTFYYPSYEILLDELRDYRFYADDMVHPTSFAIEYIWQQFADSYFCTTTKEIIKKWNILIKSVNHRPFNETTDEHQHFIRQTLLKLQDFQNKYPYFYCSKEVDLMKQRLL